MAAINEIYSLIPVWMTLIIISRSQVYEGNNPTDDFVGTELNFVYELIFIKPVMQIVTNKLYRLVLFEWPWHFMQGQSCMTQPNFS